MGICKMTESKDMTSKNRIKDDTAAVKTQKPTKKELSIIATHTKKLKSTPKPLKYKEKVLDNGKVELTLTYRDTDLARAIMAETTGSINQAFSQVLLNQAMLASCSSKDKAEAMVNAVSAAMLDLAPRNTLEGMLSAQIVAVHNQSMECLRRASLEELSLELAIIYQNQAAKLMKTFIAQMEALKKYRTGGKQKITVEHVHVHQGGQAIVGAVNQERGGRNEN